MTTLDKEIKAVEIKIDAAAYGDTTPLENRLKKLLAKRDDN